MSVNSLSFMVSTAIRKIDQLCGSPTSNTTLWKGRCSVNHLGHKVFCKPLVLIHTTQNVTAPLFQRGCAPVANHRECKLHIAVTTPREGYCTPVINHRRLPSLDKHMYRCVQPQSCFVPRVHAPSPIKIHMHSHTGPFKANLLLFLMNY